MIIFLDQVIHFNRAPGIQSASDHGSAHSSFDQKESLSILPLRLKMMSLNGPEIYRSHLPRQFQLFSQLQNTDEKGRNLAILSPLLPNTASPNQQ